MKKVSHYGVIVRCGSTLEWKLYGNAKTTKFKSPWDFSANENNQTTRTIDETCRKTVKKPLDTDCRCIKWQMKSSCVGQKAGILKCMLSVRIAWASTVSVIGVTASINDTRTLKTEPLLVFY